MDILIKKILFVSSGKEENQISPIVFSQGLSLENSGIIVNYFTVEGSGSLAYLKAIFRLRSLLEKESYDLIHAHYGLCGIVATLSCSKPLVVSLMGSDVNSNRLTRYLIKLFCQLFWRNIIAKSENIAKKINIDRIAIIPNGVDVKKFDQMEKSKCQNSLGWDTNKKHILFAADPRRKVKNFTLAENAVRLLNQADIQLHYLQNVVSEDMPIWMNASDIVLLTSISEGSPNVIKEAMACNRPIVSTNVGDVAHIIGNTKGCYIIDFDPISASIQINKAMKFSELYKNTEGRQRIFDLLLDDEQIAKTLINFYNQSLKILTK